MKKMFIVITFLCIILIGCKGPERDYRVKANQEYIAEPEAEQVELEEDQFPIHVKRVQELINVFDVVEEHDDIYRKVQDALIGLTSKKEKKAELRKVVKAHMDGVKEKVISDYVNDTFEINDEDLIMRFSNQTENDGIVNIVVEYEWFYYERDE